MRSRGIAFELSEAWGKGGQGAAKLADAVCKACEENTHPAPAYTYDAKLPLADKIQAVAAKIYGAAEVDFASGVLSQLKKWEQEGYAEYPVCIAKTQYSLSDNPKLLGAPNGYTLSVRSVRLSAGAGFVVAFAGDIIAMPGLPKAPAALSIDVDEDGNITGLF
jgi:formate--tetrahydrofolate ligase